MYLIKIYTLVPIALSLRLLVVADVCSSRYVHNSARLVDTEVKAFPRDQRDKNLLQQALAFNHQFFTSSIPALPYVS